MSNPTNHQAPAPPLDLAQFVDFTPGPWTLLISDYDEDGLDYAEVERQSPRPYQAAQGICKIHGWGAAYSRDAEQKANAALIAAAPDLLAECQRQRAEIERLQAAANERRDKSIAWCAYCGMESKPGATVEEIREHISVCPSHPMARLQELVNDYDSRLTAARNRIEELELAARDRTTPLCGYCLLPFGKTPTPAEVAEHHKTCEAARAALSWQEGGQ